MNLPAIYSSMQKGYHWFIQITVQWLSPDRIKLYPPHIPVLLLILWMISIYFGSGIKDMAGNVIGADFIAFYTGGKFFQENRMDELYNFSAQEQFQKQVTQDTQSDGADLFLNPPFTVLFFSLFSAGNYLHGLYLWWFVGLLILYFSILILQRELEGLKSYSAIKLLFYSLCFPPLLYCIAFGQNSIFTFFIYTLFFIFLRNGQDFYGGLTLGFLLYKPQLGLALGLIILFKKRWKALLGVIVSGSICLASGFAICTKAMLDFCRLAPSIPTMLRFHKEPCPYPSKSDIPLDIIHYNTHYIHHMNYPTDGIQSFFGFCSLLFDKIVPQITVIVYYIIILLLGLYFITKTLKMKWNPKSREWDLTMAGLMSLGLLLSPHLFDYDLTLLLLPICILLHQFPNGTNNRSFDGGSILAWTFFLYLFCLVGRTVTIIQLKITHHLGIPEMAFQILPIILLLWCMQIFWYIDSK